MGRSARWCVIAGLMLAGTIAIHARQVSSTWPYYNTTNWLEILGDPDGTMCVNAASGFTLTGCQRQCDLLTPGSQCNLVAHYTTTAAPHVDPSTAGVQVMYYVHGVAVSGWLAPPFHFTLSIANPALAALPDGVHDISLDVQSGANNRQDFHFIPMLLHLHRGAPFATS